MRYDTAGHSCAQSTEVPVRGCSISLTLVTGRCAGPGRHPETKAGPPGRRAVTAWSQRGGVTADGFSCLSAFALQHSPKRSNGPKRPRRSRRTLPPGDPIGLQQQQSLPRTRPGRCSHRPAPGLGRAALAALLWVLAGNRRTGGIGNRKSRKASLRRAPPPRDATPVSQRAMGRRAQLGLTGLEEKAISALRRKLAGGLAHWYAVGQACKHALHMQWDG